MLADRPNIIVILADQLRYDMIGSEHTPNIQALMADGCTFPNAYCASPLCVPSRGAFFTGRYPNETGSLINPWIEADKSHGFVREDVTNLYALLENDWDCWHTGKQHLMYRERLEDRTTSNTKWNTLDDNYEPFLKSRGDRAPGGPRFRAMVPELISGTHTAVGEYSTPATGRYEPGFDSFFDGYILNTSLDAIEDRDRTKPFFLSAMFLAPHPPLEIPEPWYSMVGNIDLPANVGHWSPGQSPLQLYNLPGYLGSHYNRDDWREVWRVYAGLVRLLDHCVGEIVAKLKAEGLYENSLIVFSSDHGEMLGSHRLWQKMCMYEESVRTPLVFKLPHQSLAGQTCPDLISQIDVLPTVCGIAGIEAPADLPGRSVFNRALDGTAANDRTIYIQYDGNGALGNFSRCIIQGSRKLIVDLFKDETFFELYDLTRDPQEQNNVVSEQRDIARDLLGQLTAHMSATADHLTLTDEALDQFLLRRYGPQAG